MTVPCMDCVLPKRNCDGIVGHVGWGGEGVNASYRSHEELIPLFKS